MMGLTESARHLPPLGTEEALRPLSRRSAECRHVFNSDTAPCHSMLGSLQAAFSSTLPAACYASRRKMWLESEGWIVRRVMTCDPEPPLKRSR